MTWCKCPALIAIVAACAVAGATCGKFPFAPSETTTYQAAGGIREGQNLDAIERQVDKILSLVDDDRFHRPIYIRHPCDGAVFPPDMASPEVSWEDGTPGIERWLVVIGFEDDDRAIWTLTARRNWVPDRRTWERVRANSRQGKARLRILGLTKRDSYQVASRGTVVITTARDRVGVPIMYLQMPLPFAYAERHPELSRWLLADLASYDSPRVVIEGLHVCGNCHGFSNRGHLFGMDVDYHNDKGAYVLTKVQDRMTITNDDLISWNDIGGPGQGTSMGLFSRISPDGNFVVSTVFERSFFASLDDINFSQFFFPIRGRIAYYAREQRRFSLLPGADDPAYVQTCPEWSPDGKYVVFARARLPRELLEVIGDKKALRVGPEVRIDDLNRKYRIYFDLYRLPFNDGKGGTPEPLPGASHNGKSNYFPRYSPDGKWIVFTRADTGLAIQPDSRLCILPAQGGVAREMRCNREIMNSWHSWSPNSRWLAFSSKVNTPYTELFLTHVDEHGNDSPPVLLSRFKDDARACLVPEFANIGKGALKEIRFSIF
jgi:hypothetical protein